MTWSPWLVGFYRKGEKLALAFFIFGTEEQFRDSGNVGNL